VSDYPPPPPPGGEPPPPPPPPPGGFSGGGAYGAGGGQYPPQGGGGFGGPAEKINNWLVPAILATLFCCLPTGIVAIIMAAQVNSKLAQGDVAGAQESAKKAKTWTFVSVGLGLLAIILWVVFVVFLGVVGNNVDNDLSDFNNQFDSDF
jgi:uncharacterized membrane protein